MPQGHARAHRSHGHSHNNNNNTFCCIRFTRINVFVYALHVLNCIGFTRIEHAMPSDPPPPPWTGDEWHARAHRSLAWSFTVFLLFVCDSFLPLRILKQKQVTSGTESIFAYVQNLKTGDEWHAGAHRSHGHRRLDCLRLPNQLLRHALRPLWSSQARQVRPFYLSI